MDLKDMIIKSQSKLKIVFQDKNQLIVKARYGPSKETRIPLNLDECLSFFIATIIGDGHIRKDKFQISIELTNYELLSDICLISKIIFNRDFKIHSRKPEKNQKPSFVAYFDSKSIYNLLNKVFKIPVGEKSCSVKVPKWIKNNTNSIKSAFLIGIMVTEGGKRKRGLGLSTASLTLRRDLLELMKNLKLKTFKDEWINKKYNKKYYGLAYKKIEIEKIERNCKNKEIVKIINKCHNLR